MVGLDPGILRPFLATGTLMPMPTMIPSRRPWKGTARAKMPPSLKPWDMTDPWEWYIYLYEWLTNGANTWHLLVLPRSWKWKMCPSKISLVKINAILHFHDHGRKGSHFVFFWFRGGKLLPVFFFTTCFKVLLKCPWLSHHGWSKGTGDNECTFIKQYKNNN